MNFALLKFKLFNRLVIDELPAQNQPNTPIIYVVPEQSKIDAEILKHVLPSNTAHLQNVDKIETALAANSSVAVYLPHHVEPDEKAFSVFQTIADAARKTDAAIVTLYLSGARFHHSSHFPENQSPRQRFPKLHLHASKPHRIEALIAASSTSKMPGGHAIFDQMAKTRIVAQDFSIGLFKAMVRAAKTYGPDRTILEDTVTGSLSYKKLLTGAHILGRKFSAISKPSEAMGVLLPNANGAIVSFFALQSAGRVAAMLNYTAGPKNVVSAISTASIKTVITSRAFVEKAELEHVIAAIEENGTHIIWLEDVRSNISALDKVVGLLNWQRPLHAINAKDPAVILFTSGSEGTPKGVVLSHRNLHYNAAQAESRVEISVKDTLFNVLPVFHSFGLSGGAILPLFFGLKLFLYPSPLHYKLIPAAARKVRPTIMFGTDTFLMGYARTAKDLDFESLRFVVAGAEAVKTETSKLYKKRFDCWILEGFGMTEAAPVVAINTHTHTKPNTVGRLLPDMDIRLEPVDGIEGGSRMWLRGPNIMLGYMKADKPGTLQPLEDGWHDSGDIVALDNEGFIQIRGRAKRFAKIAGEMVSLGAVEMLVQSLWPEDQHAVVSVPDKRKGERIILATTNEMPEKSTLIAHSKKSGVTELMVPSDILKFDDIPVLGSGKVDYVSTKKQVEKTLGIDADAS